MGYKKNCIKSSINEVECRKIGTLIGQNRKLIHYDYDINTFIDTVNLYIKAKRLIA